MQKIVLTAMLLATAFVLIGGSFGMAALAATTQQTLDNVKQAVIRTSTETLILNLNSIPGKPGNNGTDGAPGAQGLKGDKGDPGSPGVPGRDGVNGTNGKDGANGMNGRDGINGTNGKDGVSTICVVSGNQTCGLSPANSTHAITTFTTKNSNCVSLGLAPYSCTTKK